ncbi:unnamed protein product [Rotaria socialis]
MATMWFDEDSSEDEESKINPKEKSEIEKEEYFYYANKRLFFGENKKCAAHPCFAQWLMEKAKDADALLTMDRDKLRRHIMKCHNYTELCEDYSYEEWKNKDEHEKIIDA